MKATNAIYLEDSAGVEGRPFKARFLQAGLVKYDFGVCLLKKETIDKFINTFVGTPVIIDHKDDLTEADRLGTINKVWFSAEDGWFWCSGILTGEKAVKLIEEGYNVSCQYRITDYADNTERKLHNANPYDKEILNGVFEHLAIVENPRYEDAFIAVNAYIASKRRKSEELAPVSNSITDSSKDFNPNVTINKASNKFEKVFDYIRNTKGESMDNETKGLLAKLTEALLARNEAEEKKEDEKDPKASNEDIDKRKLIDEVGGILKGKVDEEVWRTIIGKIEKVAYDKSETGTADNKAKNEDDEDAKNKCRNEEVDKRDLIRQIMAIAGKHEDNEDVRTIAKLAEKLAYDKSEAGTADNAKAKNKKACNEDDEKLYDELKDKVDKAAENKAKNSFDEAVNQLYSALAPDAEPYNDGIELGNMIYGK